AGRDRKGRGAESGTGEGQRPRWNKNPEHPNASGSLRVLAMTMNETTRQGSLEASAERVEFERFFREGYPQLARACYLLTGDAAEAEDLAQESMARIYERWDRVSNMGSPDGYLYSTAFNLNRKRLRALAVRARRLVGSLPSPDPAEIAGSNSEVLEV